MANNAVKWVIITGVVFGSSSAAWAVDVDAGALEFRSSCAPCHGLDGKGKGPVSVRLTVPPADLTILSKKNNGVFPVKSTYETIDGRKQVQAHGTREMPIWGFRFVPSPYAAVNPELATEITLRARILAIVDYLNRIQE